MRRLWPGLAAGLCLLCLAFLAGWGWFRLQGSRSHPPAPPRSSRGSGKLGWPATRPVHVLPTNAAVVDLLLPLLGPKRLAGLPEQALVWSSLAGHPGGYQDLPRFRRYVAETVLALGPDLVVTSSFSSANASQRLREAGIPVLRLSGLHTMPEVYEAFEILGRALHEERRARDVVAALKARCRRLQAQAAPRHGIRILSYFNYGSGGWSAARGSSFDEVLRLAGYQNAAAAAGRQGDVPMSFEEILSLHPDVVVVSAPAAGLPGAAAILQGEPRLAGLAAVCQGRIVVLPPRLLAGASQSMVEAAELLVKRVKALKLPLGQVP